MTIIEPKKIKSKIKLIILPILAVFMVGSLAIISLYNQTVDLKYRLIKQEKALETIKVSNAELKNKLYANFDSNILSQFAQELGLVLDKKPVYLEAERTDIATNL